MKKKAFTLIELMVVIAIILILAASIAGAFKRAAINHRSDTSTNSQSTYVTPQAPAQAPSVSAGSMQFTVNDSAEAARVRSVLEHAGYKVEPVTGNISLVYKLQ